MFNNMFMFGECVLDDVVVGDEGIYVDVEVLDPKVLEIVVDILNHNRRPESGGLTFLEGVKIFTTVFSRQTL